MKKQLYFLGSCTTCSNIMKQIGINANSIHNWYLQDIKKQPVTEQFLNDVKDNLGSYAAFFSKNAIKYKTMGLKNQNLEESDYKRLMLAEYTFIKRPIIIIDDTYYIGNSKEIITKVMAHLTLE